MLKKVNIDWITTNIDEILKYEDAYFYVFTRGSSLLYIGIAYHQDVNREIKQTIREFNLDSEKLSIWLGFIEDTDFGRITEEIVKDIECLLIYINKPSLNTSCKESYAGRDNLMVLSDGCPYLMNCIKCEDDEISEC